MKITRLILNITLHFILFECMVNTVILLSHVASENYLKIFSGLYLQIPLKYSKYI